ncbi:MAG: hypothetical protein ACON35_05050 [Candidatus Marinamargulisbacteria bacterium]
MHSESEKDISIKFPENFNNVIIKKEVKVMEFLNKKVQISYHLN